MTSSPHSGAVTNNVSHQYPFQGPRVDLYCGAPGKVLVVVPPNKVSCQCKDVRNKRRSPLLAFNHGSMLDSRQGVEKVGAFASRCLKASSSESPSLELRQCDALLPHGKPAEGAKSLRKGRKLQLSSKRRSKLHTHGGQPARARVALSNSQQRILCKEFSSRIEF